MTQKSYQDHILDFKQERNNIITLFQKKREYPMEYWSMDMADLHLMYREHYHRLPDLNRRVRELVSDGILKKTFVKDAPTRYELMKQ